jgi:hypothetical protein
LIETPTSAPDSVVEVDLAVVESIYSLVTIKILSLSDSELWPAKEEKVQAVEADD